MSKTIRNYSDRPSASAREEMLTQLATHSLEHALTRDVPKFGSTFGFISWGLRTLHSEYNAAQLESINLVKCFDQVLRCFGPLTVHNFSWQKWEDFR